MGIRASKIDGREKPCGGKTKGGGRSKLVSRKHKPTKDKGV